MRRIKVTLEIELPVLAVDVSDKDTEEFIENELGIGCVLSDNNPLWLSGHSMNHVSFIWDEL